MFKILLLMLLYGGLIFPSRETLSLQSEGATSMGGNDFPASIVLTDVSVSEVQGGVQEPARVHDAGASRAWLLCLFPLLFVLLCWGMSRVLKKRSLHAKSVAGSRL